MGLSVAVVLCTFNGLPFLDAQLRSLRAQRGGYDELIISDDASDDGTWQALLEFAADDAKVTLRRNPVNLGFRANVATGLGLVRSDLVALCDQDDVWHEDKLTRQRAAFEADPMLDVLFTDATVIDDSGKRLPQTSFERLGFDPHHFIRATSEERAWLLIDQHVATGATMMLRARLVSAVLPLPDEPSWHFHDSWIAALGATLGKVAADPVPSIDYRAHGGQVIGLPTSSSQHARAPSKRTPLKRMQEFTFVAERCGAIATRARDRGARGMRTADPEFLDRLARKAHHFAVRAQAQTAWSPWLVAREAARGGYREFSRGARSAVVDLTPQGLRTVLQQ